MRQSFNHFYYWVYKPLKKWFNKHILGDRDNDDNQFNHPYAIF
jgi:hypothetical protein